MITLQLQISKKGLALSNHKLSVKFETLAECVLYTASLAWIDHQWDVVVLKVTVFDNYARKTELLEWLKANPERSQVVEGHTVTVKFMLIEE